MLLFDELAEVFQSIRRHRVRTVLTAFGVFWGIFILVLLLGAGIGLRRGAENLFRDDAVNSVWVESEKTSIPFAGYGPGRAIEMTIDDLEQIAEEIPGVENISPRKRLPGQYTVTHGQRSGSFEILGIYPGYAETEKTLLRKGRLLNHFDVQEHRKVVVIGERVVELLFGSENPIGRWVSINGVAFQVVGTFTDEGGWEGELLRIYIPYSTLRLAFDYEPTVSLITFTLAEGYSGDSLEAPIRRLLARRHRFDPKDPSAVYVYAMDQRYQKIQTLFLGLNVFVSLVGLGTLLAGVVGVSNILLVSVKERTREIGVRKALGAAPLAILRMILLEALAITLTAGYLGLLAGAGLIEAVRRSGAKADFFRDPEVPLPLAISALIVLIIAGLIAGLLPAWQAVRIRPVEALRSE